jgi:hypothetical protein
VQARRNYTIVEYMPSGELIFDIRVEKAPGVGETVGYVWSLIAESARSDGKVSYLRSCSAMERA